MCLFCRSTYQAKNSSVHQKSCCLYKQRITSVHVLVLNDEIKQYVLPDVTLLVVAQRHHYDGIPCRLYIFANYKLISTHFFIPRQHTFDYIK